MTLKSDPGYEGDYSFATFLRGEWLSVFLIVICAAGVFGMCMVLGCGMQGSILISAFVLICASASIIIRYARGARFWKGVAKAADAEQAQDAAALVADAKAPEAVLCEDAIERIVGLSNSEQASCRRELDDYRSYVELWIHETKTPIAAAKLTLSHMTGPEADALARELERVDAQVDQALYYARSTSVQKDYSIRSTSLLEAVREACKRQARFLIERQAIPDIQIGDDVEVLADAPWLVFMIGQAVANAAQYGASSITFTSHEEEPMTPHGRTILEIRDDGCGISAADISRVFERGFTGSNGRESGTATGMGLYLIALMCNRLGLGVAISSEEGSGTAISFSFPHDRRHLA